VDGVDVLSLNKGYVARYIDQALRQFLETQGWDFSRDWEKMTNEEGVELLRHVEGLAAFSGRGGITALDGGYVLTVDNLLKMLSIQLRMKFNLPVIIMGETGCGKSSLIRNLCALLGATLHTLNVHGGMTDEDIVTWMREKIQLALLMGASDERIVVFFDEVNTCNSMGLFKEIVCDRCMDGLVVPDNIKIIAACNPYRLRTAKSLYGGEEMAGLVFEHQGTTHSENVGTGIKDPLRNLVYRVHPLPEAMIDHIFDFGSLSSETERLYIMAMLRKQLGVYNPEGEEEPVQTTNAHGTTYAWVRMTPFEELVEVFTELVCAAQECIRRLYDGAVSTSSAGLVSIFTRTGSHTKSGTWRTSSA